MEKDGTIAALRSRVRALQAEVAAVKLTYLRSEKSGALGELHGVMNLLELPASYDKLALPSVTAAPDPLPLAMPADSMVAPNKSTRAASPRRGSTTRMASAGPTKLLAAPMFAAAPTRPSHTENIKL